MVGMILTLTLFVIGFALLIKGADFLVDGAASVAKKFNISNLAIGLTVVAFGTSAPEFVVNIFSSLSGRTDIAIGNIIGSNIANVFLILGAAAIVYPLTVQRSTTWREIPMSLLAAAMVGLMANDIAIDKGMSNAITRIDGFVLLSFFIIFLYYIYGIAKAGNGFATEEVKEITIGKSLMFVGGGFVALVVGGKWIVDGAVVIAEFMGISQSVIGLTVVAIGTSLPELATSVVAAYRKHADIAIGNVVGSNIFNVFWILGISSIVNPLPLQPGSNFSIGIMALASILLFAVLFIGKKHVMERWQGALFLVAYAAYIGSLLI